MPVVSKAQNAAMHAAASGNSTLGIPAKVGAEFTSDQAPGSVKDLPERVAKKPLKPRVKKMIKRGTISNKVASRFGQDEAQDVDASSR